MVQQISVLKYRIAFQGWIIPQFSKLDETFLSFLSTLREREDLEPTIQSIVQEFIRDTENLTHTIHSQHTHATSREVGDQHTESDWNKQQRFILLLDTQIEQKEGQKNHYEV